MRVKSLILSPIYKTVKTGKPRQGIYYLFMLTALAGIAVFVSAWNSWLQGKEKMLLSFSFLLIFLVGLLFLFYLFVKLLSEVNDSKTHEDQPDKDSLPPTASQKNDGLSPRDSSADLLKGAFGKPDIKSIGEKILKNLAQEFEIVQGTIFVLNPESGLFTYASSYACTFETPPPDFASGEGINGQAAADQRMITIPNLPDSYKPVFSGLGKGKARYLYVIPLVSEKITQGIIEISCFKEIDDNRSYLLNKLMREGGQKLSSVLLREQK